MAPLPKKPSPPTNVSRAARPGFDFVSRFFAPAAGVNEDPVTGSAHCQLTPWWAARLGRRALHARQVSRRGGELWVEPGSPGAHFKMRLPA